MEWPILLLVDSGREFMDVVSQRLAKYGVSLSHSHVDTHHDQGIVERFNRTLAEWLYGHQYTQKMRLTEGARSSEWVARLPAMVSVLNGEVIWLTGKIPKDTITFVRVAQKPLSVVTGIPDSLKEQKIPSGIGVQYLYQPGKLEGGRGRATDPVWYLIVHKLGCSVTKPD